MRHRRIAVSLVWGLLLIGCGDPGPEPAASGPSVNESPEPSPEPSESPEPTPVPEPVQPTHGERYWAVYVAFGPFGSAEIEDGIQRLADLGIDTGSSSLGCDQGADRIFDTDEPDAALVGVYFGPKRDAVAFLASLDEPTYGPVRVRTFCLD